MELLNIKNYVKERKESLKKHSKGANITIFQVRGNPASERYVRNKIKDMNEVVIAHRLYKFDDNVSPNDFYSKLSFVCTNSHPCHVELDY
jgi:5,10-methylene-tetrahydrofolate dehydrogenase/methenyl tetrahydrofolate cyclohydrolase